MGKDKLRKFAENLTFDNLVQPEFDEIFHRDHPLKGHWGTDFFDRKNWGKGGDPDDKTCNTDKDRGPDPDNTDKERICDPYAGGSKSGDRTSGDRNSHGTNSDRGNHPIILELGCGKGEYTVGLGAAYPDRNFIGVDIKGARMWRGAKTATEMGLQNVGFLRTRIEFINSFFAPGEISEIWITFPDPQLKKGREKKRLTSPVFLAYYGQFLAPGGLIHLKTDSRELHDYTLEVARELGLPLHVACADIYGENLTETNPLLAIKTAYERQFLAEGKPITYLSMSLK